MINYCNGLKIPIEFISQGLKTIDEDGKENPISKMVISFLGIISGIERNLSRDRQLEGIALARLRKDKYLGRKKGSKETTLDFLSKPKNKPALEYLRKGFKNIEISKLVGLHENTLTKIRKCGLINQL